MPDTKLKVVENFSKELQPLINEINNLFIKYNITNVKETISFPIRNNEIAPITNYTSFPDSLFNVEAM